MPSERSAAPGRSKLAAMIDATLVRPHATQADIVAVCDSAVQLGFAAVSVNPVWVPFCARRLQGTPVKVATVIGFPLGAATARMKLEEAREALQNGAGELDVVMNLGALRSGFPKFAEREIAAIVASAGKIPVRVIIEACFLTRDERNLAGEVCVHAGAAGIQTATGYGTTGATFEDVILLREVTRGRLAIKAAGGIRSYGIAADFIAAGATRIGTSAGAEILEQAPPEAAAGP